MARVDARFATARRLAQETNLRVLLHLLRQQRDDVARSGGRLVQAWNRDLAALILRRNRTVATDIGSTVARQFQTQFDPDVMDELLSENADITAQQINDATRERIRDFGHVEAFERTRNQTPMYASTMAALAVNFGAREGARQGGARWKVWRTNSGNPRSSHAVLNGERVRIDAVFSNGLRWPGDGGGGDVEDRANCQCSMDLE